MLGVIGRDNVGLKIWRTMVSDEVKESLTPNDSTSSQVWALCALILMFAVHHSLTRDKGKTCANFILHVVCKYVCMRTLSLVM